MSSAMPHAYALFGAVFCIFIPLHVCLHMQSNSSRLLVSGSFVRVSYTK
jgi:hypothetical protein